MSRYVITKNRLVAGIITAEDCPSAHREAATMTGLEPPRYMLHLVGPYGRIVPAREIAPGAIVVSPEGEHLQVASVRPSKGAYDLYVRYHDGTVAAMYNETPAAVL